MNLSSDPEWDRPITLLHPDTATCLTTCFVTAKNSRWEVQLALQKFSCFCRCRYFSVRLFTAFGLSRFRLCLPRVSKYRVRINRLPQGYTRLCAWNIYNNGTACACFLSFFNALLVSHHRSSGRAAFAVRALAAPIVNSKLDSATYRRRVYSVDANLER